MSTVLLFVTAKMPIESVNRFLSESQAIRDLIENSVYGLIRDKSVNRDDIDDPGTEPPVQAFESGFLGASDDDLWKVLDKYDKVEQETNSSTFIDYRSIAVLDERAEKDETVLILYKTEDEEKTSWRVPYRFVTALHADLPDEEDTYLKPEMVDENGVLCMKKIKDDLGAVWPYE